MINGRGRDGIRGESGARGGKSHIFDEPLGTRLLPLPNGGRVGRRTGRRDVFGKGNSLERRRDGWMDGDKVLMVGSSSVPTGH